MSEDRKARFLALLREIELDIDYRTVPLDGLGADVQGWGHEDEIFDYVIRHWAPRVIVEVGSWKGASAIRMADLQKSYGIDGLVVCVDTWLGSNESLWRVAENRNMLMLRHGMPGMFAQFVANVVATGNAERIRHLPMTSSCAAELLRLESLTADAIYIDAGHQEDEVYADITAYWPVLKPGGIYFGDDYSASWPGTVKAVNRFAAETGLKLRGTDWKWMFIKPE